MAYSLGKEKITLDARSFFSRKQKYDERYGFFFSNAPLLQRRVFRACLSRKYRSIDFGAPNRK
jgi:hypothetical protein